MTAREDVVRAAIQAATEATAAWCDDPEDARDYPTVAAAAAVDAAWPLIAETVRIGHDCSETLAAPTLWTCPDCAFTFSAEHTDPDGGLSCPVCESADLRERIAADPALADLMAQGMEEHRIAGATGAPWYKRPGGTRIGKDWQQSYACKCRQWEGTHSEHEAHVAAALTALIAARIARGGQS